MPNNEMYYAANNGISKKLCLFNISDKSFKKIQERHIASKKKIAFHKGKLSIVDESSQKSIKISGNIPKKLNVNHGQNFIFISHEQTYLTHGFHKYPAKFFPELPKWLIQKYSNKGDCILDSFSGSGTTNIEALLLERDSIGIDIDPFARFISKVKTTKLNLKQLESTQEKIFQSLMKYKSELIKAEYLPNFPYMNHWFRLDVIKELAYIKQTILRLNATQNIKNFYLLCFSSIIRSVSNASNECTRTVVRKKYVNDIQPYGTLQAFYNTVVSNTLKYIDFHDLRPKGIKIKFPNNMDARNIKISENSIDMALTSPPYINAVDYPRTHQLELYWLGFYSDTLVNLKKRHIGTENVYVKDYKEFKRIGIRLLDEKLINVFKKDPRRSYIAYKYFIDMQKNLKEIYRVLKKGGRYVIVVGNNNIRGENFENWKYLSEIATNIGFTRETYFSSEIIRHFMRFNKKDKIKMDWVIVLQK